MPRGYSLIEVLVATVLLVIVTAMAVPIGLYSAEYSRAAGAARYLAARIVTVRMEALKRSTHVALRFENEDGDYRFSTYIDGNGNGIRISEVTRQMDFPLARTE